MPSTSCCSSLNRRGPASRASINRNDHRSPTCASAASSESGVCGIAPSSPTAGAQRGPDLLSPICACTSVLPTSSLLFTSYLLDATCKPSSLCKPQRGDLMSYVDELQRATGAAARNAGPSVVRIGRGGGRGSGVVVAEGLVLTNAHN